MAKIIVEYKAPVTRNTSLEPGIVLLEEVRRDEHEVSRIDSSVSFNQGSLLIHKMNGTVAGYSAHSYIRLWSVEG
jgi:hypothetical protein